MLMIGLAGFFALALVLTHLFASNLRFLGVIPRSRWLSIAGGVAIAYVFVRLIPELNNGQESLIQLGVRLPFIEYHVYILALTGLIIFYGLERLALTSRGINRQQTGQDETTLTGFIIHVGSFGVYNLLIGYLLLHLEKPGWLNLTFFFVAMALHFLVNDYGLREHHKERYLHLGRWILAWLIIVGWLIGYWIEINKIIVSLLFAFLAGGVVLNTIKEELPEQRQSRFWAFVIGAGAYAAILLTL